MISEDRQKLFAHLLVDGLWGDELIDFDEDNEDVVLREIRRVIGLWVNEQGDIDEAVREKIQNLKRDVPEGSSEYKILYKQYYADEMARRGHK